MKVFISVVHRLAMLLALLLSFAGLPASMMAQPEGGDPGPRQARARRGRG